MSDTITTIQSVFHFEGYKQIRTQLDTQSDTVMFCGKDIAEALGYKKPENALASHVDDDDKKVCRLGLTLIQGGNPNMTFISESGVYSLIFKSRLKTAKQFKRWVTSEVLPAIRKSGMYSKAVAATGMNADLQHQLVTHIESQTRQMLARVDKLDMFGGLCPKGQMAIAEGVAKEFNVPSDLVMRLILQGRIGIN